MFCHLGLDHRVPTYIVRGRLQSDMLSGKVVTRSRREVDNYNLGRHADCLTDTLNAALRGAICVFYREQTPVLAKPFRVHLVLLQHVVYLRDQAGTVFASVILTPKVDSGCTG